MRGVKERLYLILASVVIAAMVMVWAKTRVVPSFSDASRMVIAAANADNTQMYTAHVTTSVHYGDTMVKSLSRVYHTPQAERIDYIKGPLEGCTSIRRGGTTVLLKHGHAIWVTKTAPAISQSLRLALLLSNYRAARTEDSSEPGRPCDVVVLIPRKGDGHSRKLWIDKKTHITLINNDWLPDQRTISHSSMVLEEVQVVPDRLLKIPALRGILPASEPMDCNKLSNHLRIKVSLPKYVTDGYVLDGSCLYRCACNCGHESAHLTFTNGMDTISVFETGSLANCGAKKCDLKGGLGSGDCAVRDGVREGVAVVRARNKIVITVGDVGGSELMRIARSVP